MLIKKIKMDGFKNIFDTTMKLSDVTAIVGLNNYGKTNILEFLKFSEEYIKANSIKKREMMSSADDIPINSAIANNPFTFEIEYITSKMTDYEEEQFEINYSFSFNWIKDGDEGCKVKAETLKIKNLNEGLRPTYSSYVKREGKEAFYKSSLKGRVDTKIDIGNDDLVINKLISFDNLFYKSIIYELNNINFDMNNFSNAENALRTISVSGSKKNNVLNKNNGCNIAEIVYSLREDYTDKYELLIDSFKKLIPSIEGIELICIDLKKESSKTVNNDSIPFNIPEKIYDIRVKEHYNNQETSLHSLSNGSKRIFLLLTSAILSDINNISLIAFEELENSIHPYLFQKFLMILTQIITNCRILVTSHSPYLIQYLDLEKIYIGIPKKNGVATFKKVKKIKRKTIQSDARDQDISIGDYLFDMLVESFTDEEALETLEELME